MKSNKNNNAPGGDRQPGHKMVGGKRVSSKPKKLVDSKHKMQVAKSNGAEVGAGEVDDVINSYLDGEEEFEW